MGARFSKAREAPATPAETAVPEQKAAAEPAATQPAGDSGPPQTQEAVKTENPEVVLGEAVTVKACLPNEECVAECKPPEAPAASDPLTDAEPEAVAKETPAPVQPEPVVSVSKPEPVAEAQLAPEPVPEPEPVSEPEPVPEPEAEVETVPEPISESVPALAEALEQQIDLLNQESLPEPLVDLGVPDVTPPAADIAAPVIADEPLDIPMAEACLESAEVSVIPAFELERSEETPESVENLIEVEAGGNLEQLVTDVNEEDVRGLLKNLELKGNDLVADLIPTDDKIPDGVSASTELM
ncbi:uncharacterized protein LOC117261767 [Epinephelus lanceolatus]|uniref:magnetosome-associated protein MamJ-like n=1 Tax=Epinephelus lanceolatus TaxID=310571 RepID=UPI0014457267|nr:magnetosome-associated protein MamJ-like [Epinephelus lanceolatus]